MPRELRCATIDWYIGLVLERGEPRTFRYATKYISKLEVSIAEARSAKYVEMCNISVCMCSSCCNSAGDLLVAVTVSKDDDGFSGSLQHCDE